MNPAWCEWAPATFARAAAEQKPLLLSIVTAWSAECRLMDHTTYSDARVLSLIDEWFVPVRVDGDRRPDLNDRYNLGGWPTTAFLTSSGDILSGGTYLSVDEMVSALQQVAAACRTRAADLARATNQPPTVQKMSRDADDPGHDVVERFASLLMQEFDRVHGGFGAAPKLPHAYALLFALSIAEQPELSGLASMVALTLDRIGALWDPAGGGFSRYAEGDDWTRLGTEKLLEDNAALLQVFVEAALRGHPESRETASALALWVRGSLSGVNGGFYNACSPNGIDRTLYVDRNAMMAAAFIRAGALLDDVSLRDFALASIEAVIVPAYAPGAGVAHVCASPSVRGLLTDQIHTASALIWAHTSTGQLPYSMLAAELVEFALRVMWHEEGGRFRDRADPTDPVLPFELNCHAACVLNRLAALTGDEGYRDRARLILRSLAPEHANRGLFAAPYALAVREVIERELPAGLSLTPVNWGL